MRTLALLLVSAYASSPEYNKWCDGNKNRATEKTYGKNSLGKDCLMYDHTTKKLTFRKDYDCVQMNPNPSDADLEKIISQG